jgi:hypothetical protein
MHGRGTRAIVGQTTGEKNDDKQSNVVDGTPERGDSGLSNPSRQVAPPSGKRATQVCEGAICNVDVVVPSGCVINVTDVLDTRRGPSVQTINWNLKAPTGYNSPMRH